MESAYSIELLPLPDRPGRFEHARGHQFGEHLGSDERGEPVVARRAVALDLEPVDVDVGDAAFAQRPADLRRGPAAGQGLEGLVVEDRVIDDGVIQVEDRRLADEQDPGVGRERPRRAWPAAG